VYKILVLANGVFLRQGFINILENGLLGKVTKVTLASTRQEAWSLLKDGWNAVLMDLDFDRMPIFDLIADIKKTYSALPIMAFDFKPESDRVVRALRSGANGILGNVDKLDDVHLAIRTVLAGRPYVHPASIKWLCKALANNDSPPLHESLSNKELQTLSLIVAGKQRNQIAKLMSISDKTVSVYRGRVLKKLNLSSTEGLIRYGIEHNIEAL
jgi:two-component system invasion response regulator UvrY